MTADALQLCLQRLDLPVTKAARLLGVEARTARKWISGERDVPPSVALLLHLMLEVPEAARWLKEDVDE